MSYEPFVLILAAVGAVLSFLLYQVIQTKGRRRGVRRAAGRNTNVEELTLVVVRGWLSLITLYFNIIFVVVRYGRVSKQIQWY